jgi:phosphoserine phosphatase
MADTDPLLIRVSGPDRPGIAAEVMSILAAADAAIEDIEQITIRRHLSVGVVARVSRTAVETPLRDLATRAGIHLEIEPADPTPTERELGTIVTLLAQEVTPRQVSRVCAVIAEHGGNIDRIVRLSNYPTTSYELTVLGAPLDPLRRALLDVAADDELHLDLAIEPDGLGRRSRRLVVMDVDSTLIQDEVIDLLADEQGCGAEVAAITEAAMRGELDFAESLQRRVALLAGLELAAIDRVRARVRLTPGARTLVRTLKRMGLRVVLVSGGFTAVTDGLAATLGADLAVANELEILDGRLTGRVVGPIVDRARKAAVLREFAAAEGIALGQTVAVGDGANDLDMLATAGLGIAFNAKPLVRAAADASVSVPYLDALLFLLGVRRSEVEAADGADPSYVAEH